jgi:RNA polymerase sigma-70 factor (ECF subfamily)
MTGDAAEKDRQFRDEALRWLPEVGRYALSLTRDEDTAQDLTQETYLRAYRHWDQYQQGTECRGWLFTICRNRFLRDRRRAQLEQTQDHPDHEALAAAAIHDAAIYEGHGDMFERADLRAAIDAAIAELPDAYRDVAILVDLQDLSYDAAAGVLGVPVGTVRSRLSRARRVLQEKLLAHARDAGLTATGDVPRAEDHR